MSVRGFSGAGASQAGPPGLILLPWDGEAGRGVEVGGRVIENLGVYV